MKKGRILFIAGLLSLLLNCNFQDEQRIRLAKRPVEAIMRDRVKTIQLKADEKKKVAIFDLRNDTHQSDLEWLRQGLAEMLALSLAQSRQLNLIASRNVINAVASLDLPSAYELNSLQLQSVAQTLGADVLIAGRYFFQQDSLRIELKVHDGLSGEIASSHHGSSPDLNIRNIFKMVDPITHQIREHVEDRSKSSTPKEYHLADVSTSSLDAYKYYTSGIRFEDSFYLTDALNAFEKAISIDSTFASAYYRLARLHLMLKDESAAQPLIQKAMRFSERTSERERLPIQAMDAMMRGEKYNAVQYYNRYIELYPEDDNGHYQLGIYYFSVVFNFGKAIEFLETTVSLNPDHKLAYNTLAYAYAYIGELDHAYNALEKYISLAANEPNPYDSFGEILQRNGRINEAIDKYRLALKKNPLFYPSKIHLANAYLDLGKMNKARHILLPMLQNDSDVYLKINALTMLALTEIYAENIEKAKLYIHQAMSLQDQPYYLLSVLLALEPESEDYKRQFLEIIQNEKNNINRPDFHSEIVFDLVSAALINQVGVAEVRDLLNAIIKFNKDPVLYNVALAYSLVLGDSDEELGKLGRRFAESSLPGVFEYSTPPSWNYYWRFYFSSLKPTNNNHAALRFLTDGLNDFAQHSGNPYFDVQGLLASAAAEFYTGDPQIAKDMITRQGFPCEG
ncbi:MAG: hypothetical protein EHM72_04010, partial [Calditrichaeota bacterium]